MSEDGILVLPLDRCAICKKPDLRRLVDLGLGSKMDAKAISSGFGGIPSSNTVLKHDQHNLEGSDIVVPNALTLRDRALAIQRLQIEEIERRVARAQEWAAYARAHDNPDADWSQAFDILGKDMQSAIGSILKAVGLDDKRQATKVSAAVDIYKMMLGDNGGLAPKRLTAQAPIDGEYKDVTDGEDGTEA